MRKIAFLSSAGDGADVALRMALEENVKVKLWISLPDYQHNYDGILDKASSWQEAVKWADLVVFDDCELSNIWTQVSKYKPCFGGSPFMAKMEHDREYAHSLMKRMGLDAIESISFKSGREVINHLKSHEEVHVVKPTGDHVESHHLIIGKDKNGEDAISQVERLMDMKIPIKSWEVEERKFGMESGLCGWFNGEDWVGPIELNFQHKHIGEKESGPLSGESGTLLKYLEDKNNQFFKDTLDKAKPILRAANFRGQIDLGMIVNDEGAWPLEWTPRLGKPAIFIEEELHVSPWSELFWAIANGEHYDLQCRYDWAVGVVLFAFGFPWDKKVNDISKGLRVTGLTDSLSHQHPMEMLRDKKGKWIIGHGPGYVLVTTGRGEQIYDAKRRAYDAMTGIYLPNSFYRHDITDKISEYEAQRLGILPESEAEKCSISA